MLGTAKPSDKSFSVEVPGQGRVSCLRAIASTDPAWTYIYAPGAGSSLHDPFGAFAAAALASNGINTIRLQFPYMQAGKRGPDRPPVLEATWRAVIDAARPTLGSLVVGGRSMGGRIASQVVAQGVAVDAIALFAYPLHPPGKPEQMRTEHFSAIRAPVFFCSGTRDAFASVDELRAAMQTIKSAKVHLLEGADHGFAIRKSSRRTREQVWGEAVDALTSWLGELK